MNVGATLHTLHLTDRDTLANRVIFKISEQHCVTLETKKDFRTSETLDFVGRGEKTRTSDPLHPMLCHLIT